MTGAVHPWRRFRALEDWRLVRHDGGPRGLTYFDRQVVSLRRGLTQVERRCTILHECIHAERGPTVNALGPREELWVRRMTARLLMPNIKVVGEAMAWSLSNDEAADQLWVTVDVLADRLDDLHPAERHWLRRRMSEID